MVRGAAGRFDARTSDLVLRARVEAVHPNSNGRSRYRCRRYRSGPQKSGAKCEIASRIAAASVHVTLVAASHTPPSLSLSQCNSPPPPAAQNRSAPATSTAKQPVSPLRVATGKSRRQAQRATVYHMYCKRLEQMLDDGYGWTEARYHARSDEDGVLLIEAREERL